MDDEVIADVRRLSWNNDAGVMRLSAEEAAAGVQDLDGREGGGVGGG